MTSIGIFFGTDSGTTRLIAKKIARSLVARIGEHVVAKPVNINRVDVNRLLQHDALILGTPTYGKGVLPGRDSRNTESSWLEFLPQLADADFSGKRIALYGLGDQEEYPDHFADAIRDLHDAFTARGATPVGGCDIDGYEFNCSRAVIDGRFIGLVLDQHLQHLLTDERIERWLDEIVPALTGETAGRQQANG
ncbi:MAG: flavodoxin [Gammaproteobacteria bacterium]|nr:flavodoxin [Gammaproteobacteria bacterium]